MADNPNPAESHFRYPIVTVTHAAAFPRAAWGAAALARFQDSGNIFHRLFAVPGWKMRSIALPTPARTAAPERIDMASRRPHSQPPEAGRSNRARSLSPDEFADRLKDSFRILWLIAVGITRDATAAEDVVQDAAMVALGKLDDFDRTTNFTAWMSQTVRFVAYNHSRKENRRRASSVDPVDMDGHAVAPATHELGFDGVAAARSGRLPTEQTHFDDAVVRALESVSEVARSCLLLRTLADLDYAEISKLLGIPEGTAMSHVHRTRAALREQLAPAWPRAAQGGTS
jgi:RNA polymerase sigma-70 factor (ECF subfamily)